MGKVFVGIGFGAIQGGLFLYEASRSGNFNRYVVAEVIPEVAAAVRKHGGYAVNIATPSGVDRQQVDGVEIYNPSVPEDAASLVAALAEAGEIAVALPSVAFYTRGAPSPAILLAQGLRQRHERKGGAPSVTYAGENHNHAAEILEAAVRAELGADADAVLQNHRFLNTVIGKMSGVVTDEAQMVRDDLVPIAPGLPRAFLVEAFNRILISSIDLPGFERGITVFAEKDDLLPFEEAKLYGHNATHALVGYLAHERGYDTMSEALANGDVRKTAREAFLNEAGTALIAKRVGVDLLFTIGGFTKYCDDLLERMGNPYLRDQVSRIIRDPERKLGWEDRLVGTIRIALGCGLQPHGFARSAAAALKFWRPGLEADDVARALMEIWGREVPADEAARVSAVIAEELQRC